MQSTGCNTRSDTNIQKGSGMMETILGIIIVALFISILYFAAKEDVKEEEDQKELESKMTDTEKAIYKELQNIKENIIKIRINTAIILLLIIIPLILKILYIISAGYEIQSILKILFS